METLKNTIETKLNKTVSIVKANDGANLLFNALVNGVHVASIYKSFDKNFNQISIIKYVE